MSSWFGDSVGHYEGDTLVIDTVGIKTGPFTMVGQFGTPHTPALHVIDPGQGYVGTATSKVAAGLVIE